MAAMGTYSSYLEAQTQPVYQTFWLDQAFPAETTEIEIEDLVVDESVNLALAVGWYTRSDVPGRRGYVFDFFGYIDPQQPLKFWDIEDLVGAGPPSWAPSHYTESGFHGVNEHGRLVGYIGKLDTLETAGFYFDINSGQQEIQPLPSPVPSSAGFAGWRVNSNGDVLCIGVSGEGLLIFDPSNGDSIQIPLPTDFRFSSDDADLFFNSARQIVGSTFDSTGWHLFRHTTIDQNSDGVSDGITEYFSDLKSPNGINDRAWCSCTLTVEVPLRGRKVANVDRAARLTSNGTVDWESELGDGTAVMRTGEINWEGDFLHQFGVEPGAERTWYLFDEGDPILAGDEQPLTPMRDLMVDSMIPDHVRTRFFHMTERDSTGYGWTSGTADLQSNGQARAFVLFPTPPSPGLSVSPVSGLVTTEAGGNATFSVVLDAEPTADVTIGISSSDIGEGTVDQASLTFTPANWDTPQTVTITGVDDAIEDGDVVYTVITSAASSADPDYNGLDADDVAVTNLDDDGPLTYSSADTPIAIPDYNPANPQGISSTITVLDDVIVAGLTVNLNISHSRPSDLLVYLYGPDNGPPVQLFHLSGDNNVPDFNGISSQGDWTLEVYDTVKKKTGTLNGWSITVDSP
jgi:hypothetical protein